MNRRSFVTAAALLGMEANRAPAAQAPAFQGEKSKLKITGVRLVQTTPKKAPPEYQACSGLMVDGRRRGRKSDVDLSGIQADAFALYGE